MVLMRVITNQGEHGLPAIDVLYLPGTSILCSTNSMGDVRIGVRSPCKETGHLLVTQTVSQTLLAHLQPPDWRRAMRA